VESGLSRFARNKINYKQTIRGKSYVYDQIISFASDVTFAYEQLKCFSKTFLPLHQRFSNFFISRTPKSFVNFLLTRENC